MTEKEYELKMLLTNREYRFLLDMFNLLTVETDLQTNYYYDTLDEIMRKKNVTIRVREKNGKLLGTVKRHLVNGDSLEEHFHVDTLPQVIMLEGTPVWLKGSLVTERKTLRVSDGITLMLDLNQYLNTVDYELEIEYSEQLRDQAEGILMLIRCLLARTQQKGAISKSERFFQRLSNRGGSNYAQT